MVRDMKPSVGCFVQATCGFNGSPSRGHNFAGELGSYCGPKNTFDYSWPLVYGRQRNEWFEDNVCTGTGNMLGPLMTGQPLLDQGRVRRNLVSTCLSGHKIIFSHFFSPQYFSSYFLHLFILQNDFACI